jgi:hypothetical protein
MIRANGYYIQFTGNQCVEGSSKGPWSVILVGHLVVVNGNTVYRQGGDSTSLLVSAFAPSASPPVPSAIATSNILRGDPLIIGFNTTNTVVSNNIDLLS